MLLSEMKLSDERRIAKINRVLKETYGFTLNSTVEPQKVKALQDKVSAELHQLKLNQATAKDSEYIQKVLVQEGLAIIQKLNENAYPLVGPGAQAFLRVLEWLAQYVHSACEVGDDYEEAIREAMKQYRSSKYRFADVLVEHELRKKTADCVMPGTDHDAEMAIGGAGYNDVMGYNDGPQEPVYENKLNEDPGHSILDILSQQELTDLQFDVTYTGDIDMGKSYYEKLYSYYTQAIGTEGQMDYGTAKARTGDPDQWILNHVIQDYGAEVLGQETNDDVKRFGHEPPIKEANPDRYADRAWAKELAGDRGAAQRGGIATRLGGDELTLHADDEKKSTGGGDDYFSYAAKKKKVKEDEVDHSKQPSQTVDVWKVWIPANVWDGKYYDFRVVQVFVDKNTSPTEQDAIDYINNNKDEVLAKLDKKRVNVGRGTRRLVGHPVAKNVFFKDKYAVKGTTQLRGWAPGLGKSALGYKSTEAPKGNETMKEGYVKQLRKLLEAEVEQAESLIAAKSFSQELQDMVEKLGRLVNETLPAVTEQMRDAYGADVATSFENTVSGTLTGVMDSLKSSKQEIDNSVSTVSGGGMPQASTDMDNFDAGADVGADVGADLDLDADVDLDIDADELGGNDAAAGPEDEPLGRAKKESVKKTGKMIEAKKDVKKDEKKVDKKDVKKGKKKVTKEAVQALRSKIAKIQEQLARNKKGK